MRQQTTSLSVIVQHSASMSLKCRTARPTRDSASSPKGPSAHSRPAADYESSELPALEQRPA